MSTWMKKIAILAACLVGLILLAAWLLLSSSLLAKTRGDLAARFLTQKLGQNVEIGGGVSVDLGSVLRVTAQGLTLPSPAMSDVNLAEIGQLEFGLVLSDLWQGRIELHDPRIDAAMVMLVVDAGGVQSWSGVGKNANGDSEPSDKPKKKNKSFADYFAERRVAVSESHVVYRDARNGLDFDLLLTNLDASKADASAPFVLDGKGALNGEDVALKADFLAGQPFHVSAEFDRMRLSLDGAPDQAGYAGKLLLSVDEIGQLLDALKLEKSVSGTAQVTAAFELAGGVGRVPDLSVKAQLDSGPSVAVTGNLGVLGDPSDVSVYTDIRLYSDANMPAPTKTRRDLKLTRVVMELVARPDGIPQRGMVIETNGFVLDTSGEGPPPIAVSEISRTPEGKLRVGKAVLRIGAPEAPIVTLEGAIADALRLEGIDFSGILDLPAASLLGPEYFQGSDALGIVSGGFRLQGNGKVLGLSDLNAATRGTDLWNLNVTGSLRNALSFEDVALKVSVDVPSGGELLEAMSLKRVETGKVALTADVSSQDTRWQVAASVHVDESELNLSAALDLDDPHPLLKGQIESDLIRVEHLSQIVASGIQLKKLDKLENDAKQSAEPALEPKEEEPLVLNDPKFADPDTEDESESKDAIRDVTLLPLGRAILLSGMDLSVAIDLHQVDGKKGTSSLHSDLELKDNKARLGPVKFEYGAAHFDLSGSMDLEEHPEILNLSGSTGGWDFGEIMHELHFKKRANGILHGEFDVSGHHTSVRDFLTTMTGSAYVSMSQGSIETQLLDLAGLGVIPWLFSKDKGASVPIVCARAPLSISDGRISTKQTVVETDQVQIVVYGDANLAGKSLNIAGQPRKIGKPLSRSPWPFTVIGPFANPKVKLKDGPKRLARSDGATTMPQKRKHCVPDILQLK